LIPSDRLFDLLGEVKSLAQKYYDLTKRPLGVTGEVAEYEAVRLLDLELSPARQPGFDAIRRTSHENQRLQIKGRCILPNAKRGQKIGKIELDKPWDAVLLVLLDERYEPKQIYEAERPAVSDALTAPGSKARNERGQLPISKFKSIGRKVWP
jgi:hypothetical protein